MSRGSVFDLMTFFAVLVVFGISALVGVFLLQSFDEGMVESGLIDGAGAEIISENTTRAPGLFDAALITLLVGAWLYMLISGYLLFTNPAFMVVGLFFGLIVLVFIAPIANVNLSLAGLSDFSQASDLMPMTWFFFSNSVAFVVAMLVSVLVSTYSGYRLGGGGGI